MNQSVARPVRYDSKKPRMRTIQLPKARGIRQALAVSTLSNILGCKLAVAGGADGDGYGSGCGVG